MAIASREAGKAEACGRQRSAFARAHGSYEALIADPDIDAIYNPLPNHLHVPWSIRALEAGKHVLCEKPIGLSVAEARGAARGARSHGPERFRKRSWSARIRSGCARVSSSAQGRIGDAAQHAGVFQLLQPRRRQHPQQCPTIGGGALMDIGCYLIHTSRMIFERRAATRAGA